MSLGKTLATQADERAAAHIAAEHAKSVAALAKIKADKAAVTAFLATVRAAIEFAADTSTTYKSPTTQRERGDAFSTYSWKERTKDVPYAKGSWEDPASPYYPEWKEFADWATSEDLNPRLVYEHDGMGMESWYVVRID
jgi:Flp pilus assembly protein TadG